MELAVKSDRLNSSFPRQIRRHMESKHYQYSPVQEKWGPKFSKRSRDVLWNTVTNGKSFICVTIVSVYAVLTTRQALFSMLSESQLTEEHKRTIGGREQSSYPHCLDEKNGALRLICPWSEEYYTPNPHLGGTVSEPVLLNTRGLCCHQSSSKFTF